MFTRPWLFSQKPTKVVTMTRALRRNFVSNMRSLMVLGACSVVVPLPDILESSSPRGLRQFAPWKDGLRAARETNRSRGAKTDRYGESAHYEGCLRRPVSRRGPFEPRQA